MKNTLKEAEYEKIFKPETMAALKGKSGESLKQMLGNKSLMQTLMSSQQILDEIMSAEAPYRSELEKIAVDMVTKAYPIIKYANIKIDAKIGEEINLSPSSEDEEPVDDLSAPEALAAKRRIINGITQGASIRGSFAFYLFREYLDRLNNTLVDKYGAILKQVFGIYDDENAIAMMLAALERGQKMAGGESEMVYDEEAEQFVIKARALCFPMLVHEIVKGLYEIVGTQGFGADKEQNKAVIGAVDKLSNEPRDLQYGKFIYDALSGLYIESDIDDARVRELFFTEVYKLPETEFLDFIENAINGTLTSTQKQWAMGEMKSIERDLKKDDTGLENLDESKKPYVNKSINKNTIIREFNENVSPIELKWHRDKQTRRVTVLEGKDWAIQFDNKLPKTLKPGDTVNIPALAWHRVIKGKSTLKLKIEEFGK